MELEAIVSLITAATALGTAVGSLLWSRWSLQRTLDHERELQGAELRLEQLRASLQEERDAASSRRSYEFEGLRRLYEQVEPVRFQLMEAALGAGWRVQSLARSARIGDIRPDGTGWMADPRSYYMAITIHDLMLPAVLYRILRRRMTFVDFSLDPRVEWEYRLARSYYLGPTNDFSLAAVEGAALPYTPGVPDWRVRRADEPAQYWRQGLSVGLLDAFLEQLDQDDRPMSFGTFYARIRSGEATDPLLEHYLSVADVFTGFHPATRPVLWRGLLYQVVFAHTIFQSWRAAGSDAAVEDREVPALPADLMAKYAWSDDVDAAAEFAVVLGRARHETEYAFSL